MDNGYVIPFAVCPVSKREFVIPLGSQQSYTYKLIHKGRRDYFCSWTCYKTAKRKMLYQKKKLSDEERNWLKWAEGK